MSLLSKKLEGDSLVRSAETEIRGLHGIFVDWFRGEQSVATLRDDLQRRMMTNFSHVAPNGHMVKGRDVLLQYLSEKYACYADRVFSIDVYNVQVLWQEAGYVLASYEEWQSWDDEESSGKQQFGRLSTCLLQKTTNNGRYRWIHVHETWMEAEEPVIQDPSSGPTAASAAVDEETVMTGPVPPDQLAHRFPDRNNNTMTNARKTLQQSTDDDDDESSSTEAQVLPPPPTVSANSKKNNNYRRSSSVSNGQRLLMLVDTGSLASSTQIAHQEAAQHILSQHGIDYSIVDGIHPAQTDRRNELLQISNITAYPQFFWVIKNDKNDNTESIEFWGTYNDFEASNASGTLLEDLKSKKDPSIEDDEEEEDEDDEFDEEDGDKVSALKTTVNDVTMTAEEQQFMEASQGILFFEDEDEGGTADAAVMPPLPSNNNNNNNFSSHSLVDDLMETDEKSHASAAMLSLNSAADASHKRHVNAKLAPYAKPLKYEGNLVGVSIAGFDIGTSQGAIADSEYYDSTGRRLEELAQPATTGRRKIALPEMVFPVAHVALEGHGIWLSWDAMDCLTPWAKCHQHIAISSRSNSQGVSVLKTKDAESWEQRSFGKEDASAIFHYDWTFSTPFSVKMEGGRWGELDESGMRMDLLTDKSVPILFFDEIVLYEDDLHDNGQVQFSIKLRVMPTCAYVLARLWVRVDNVILRLRETRILVDFFGIRPKIYRDINWRECKWEDLASHNLPTAVRAWNNEQSGETPEWHNLVHQLPEIALPDGMIQYAVLEYGEDDKMEL